MGDKHLLEAWNKYVAKDDMTSFGRVYDVLYDDTLYFAKGKCKSSHLKAEDVVDAVWEKLAVKKPLIEENIRAYILKMTANTFFDLFRKNTIIVSYEIPEDVVSEPITSVFLKKDESKQRDIEIRQCLDKKEYDFIMQFADLLMNGYKRQKAHEQLAKALEIALQTVNNKRTSIMKKLKACRAYRSK